MHSNLLHVQHCSYTPSSLTPSLLVSLYHHPLYHHPFTFSPLPSSTHPFFPHPLDIPSSPLIPLPPHIPIPSHPHPFSPHPLLIPSQDAPFNPSMFGTTLEDVMELQSAKFPDHTLPWVIEALTDAVLKLNGPQTEGIFRYHSTVLHTTRVKSPIPRSLNCRLHNYPSKMPVYRITGNFHRRKLSQKIGESKIFTNYSMVLPNDDKPPILRRKLL